jgi:hypothetical protein
VDPTDSIRLDPEERTRCEVWTRVMGYHRPVAAFNAGKRSEHAERRQFCEQPQGHGVARRPARRTIAA